MSRAPLLPDFPRPLLFAHRGWSCQAPENTMAAFRLARERGAPGVELDVHLTADGKLAVIHDHDTGRVEGGAKGSGLPVEGSPWAALSTREVGTWKNPDWRGQRIPLLEELFEELGTELYFDIELKRGGLSGGGLEAAVAKAIRQADGGRGLARRVILSSFNPFCLARFKALMPEVPTAIIWCDEEELPPWLRRGQGRVIGRADALKPAHDEVDPGRAAAWAKAGRSFLPWTVDDAAEARRLLGLGAVGLVSNDPAALGIL